MRSPRTLALWSWGGLVCLGGSALLIGEGWPELREDYSLILLIAQPALFTILGVIIAINVPGNRLYILFLYMGTMLLATLWVGLMVPTSAPDTPTWRDSAAIIAGNAGEWIAVFIPVLLLMHIFPTGDFIARRWRWAGWAALIASVTVVVAEIAPERVYPYGPDGVEWTIPNPMGFMETATMGAIPFSIILALTLLPLLIGGVVAMVVRFRRSGLVVRSQIKWVVFSLLSFVFVGLMPAIFFEAYGINLIATILIVPISITIAITRFRLYEIDRILSRTVAYALVIAFVLVVYAAGAVWMPTQLVGEQSPLWVAATTLAIAATFNPVRRRVVSWIDQRFNRSAYDAELVVSRFSDQLRDEVDVDRLTNESLGVVELTVQPSSIGLWIKD